MSLLKSFLKCIQKLALHPQIKNRLYKKLKDTQTPAQKGLGVNV